LNQMKDQLLAAVSHDIRDPLALQVNLVELLDTPQTNLQPADVEVIRTLSEQIRNTYMVVENLLDWFRGQQEGTVLRSESILVHEIVDEACRLLVLNCETKQLQLRININQQIRVSADREALILIIRNLLSNAIKFSNPGDAITVTAAQHGDQVDISVTD